MATFNWLSISGIIVDIILFFIVAGNAVIGYRRGLVKVIFSLFSTIVALILVFVLYKPVTNFVIDNTSVCAKLESTFEKNFKYMFEKNHIENKEQLENDNDMTSILKVFIGDEIGGLIEDTADSLIKYISQQITRKIISVFVFFALFAIIRLVLYVLKSYMEMVGNLPIVRVFNGSGGMIYGVLRGFFVIYLTFAIISIIMPIINNTTITLAIQKAVFGSRMYNNNILLNLIFKFL